jgi:hypothetical protein
MLSQVFYAETFNAPNARSTALALVISATAFAGCSTLPGTTYEREFKPPSSYLSMSRDLVDESLLNETLIQKGKMAVLKIGYRADFEGAVRNDRCEAICYFYRPLYTDDLYIVVTVDSSQTKLRKWFSFSPLDSGSP